jgi:hypothetical protein
VEDSAQWELGVKKILCRSSVVHYCKIGLHNGRYRSESSHQSGEWVDLPAKQKLQRIRMKWGPTTEVSFSDPKTNQTIHSWKKTISLEKSKVLPFINSTDTVPLKVSPGKEL